MMVARQGTTTGHDIGVMAVQCKHFSSLCISRSMSYLAATIHRDLFEL